MVLCVAVEWSGLMQLFDFAVGKCLGFAAGCEGSWWVESSECVWADAHLGVEQS